MMWECKACNGMVENQGALGNVYHGRCRNCGLTQHVEIASLSEYTPEEQEQVDQLIKDAADAEDLYGADECESFAARQRERWGHD